MRNHMATYSRSSTAAAFQALADPTRRAVLDLLRQGALPAGQIAREFPVSRPAISKHLRLLWRARLVEERREGRHRLYRLNAEPLRGVDAWLNEYRNFWQSNLTRLKAFVETEHEKHSAHSRRKEKSGLEEKDGNVADQS